MAHVPVAILNLSPFRILRLSPRLLTRATEVPRVLAAVTTAASRGVTAPAAALEAVRIVVPPPLKTYGTECLKYSVCSACSLVSSVRSMPLPRRVASFAKAPS